MKKQNLQVFPSKEVPNGFYLILLIFVLSLFSSGVIAQKEFSIIEAKHNRALSVHAPDQVYEFGVPGEETTLPYPTYWKFIPMGMDDSLRQLYQIESTQYPGRSIAVPFGEDNRSIWFGPVNQNETPQRHLWRLVREKDTAELGITYRIINHHFPNEILGGGVNFNGLVYNYHLDNSLDIGKQCSWRLIERLGVSGENPEGYVPTNLRIITTEKNTRVCIYGLPGSCYDAVYNDLRFLKLGEGLADDQIVAPNGPSPNRQYYSRLQSGLDYPVTFYVENYTNGNNFTLPNLTLRDTIYDPYNSKWAGNSTLKVNFIQNKDNSPTKYIGKLNYNVPYGTTSLINRMLLLEQDPSPSFTFTQIIWPAHVSGPVDSSVAIIGNYVDPMEPVMILHDPPGDESFSEWQKSKTICREQQNTISTSMHHDLEAGMKFGFSGGIGEIVTANIDAYVKFTVGGSKGGLTAQTTSDKICLTTEEGFKTSALGASGEDVFIGFGRDMVFGFGTVVDFDTSGGCGADIVKRRFYVAQVGEPRSFAWTESRIRKDIEDLTKVYLDSLKVGPKASKEALYQIRTWDAYLRENQKNKDNAIYNSPLQISGSIEKTTESAIEIEKTSSITTERFLSANYGMEFLVEIAGNGPSGGYKFETEKRFGATTNNLTNNKDMLKYTFDDNEPEDNFELFIGKDPLFGTPIFKIDPVKTKTSCPYEGGYQRDQPRLKDPVTGLNQIIVSGIPIGKDAIFKIDVCNESNEKRDYNLKLNDNSNANLNAVVIAGGTPINNNTKGRSYSVNAGDCIQVEVIVRQITLSKLEYPNLELILTPNCEDESNIKSNIFLSAFFELGTASNDAGRLQELLSVYPNPANKVLIADIHTLEPGNVHFELSNLIGNQVLYSENSVLGSHIQTKIFDISHIPSGVYLFSAITEKRNHVKKISIKH